MLNVENKSAGIEAASLIDEAPELKLNELDRVAGGAIDVSFHFGADTFVISADSNSYSVSHIHYGK